MVIGEFVISNLQNVEIGCAISIIVELTDGVLLIGKVVVGNSQNVEVLVEWSPLDKYPGSLLDNHGVTSVDDR